MPHHLTQSSPLFVNDSLSQEGPGSRATGPFMAPFDESGSDSERPSTPSSSISTFSSPNESLASLTTPNSLHFGRDVHITTGDLDAPPLTDELVTPLTAYPLAQKQGSGDTICQSPRPFHAHNALGLMLEQAASTQKNLPAEDDCQTPPTDPEEPEVPPPTVPPMSQQMAEFLRALSGHQLTVEEEAERTLRISLGPFVVQVLLIAPQ